MTKSVVGFLKDCDNRVLLIRKTRPSWQVGWLNGIGGKIEAGETAHDAMLREWSEETGIVPAPDRHFCMLLSGGDYEVHFFSGETPLSFHDHLDGRTHNDVGEKFEIVALEDARHEKVIPNLKWLLPLAFDDPRMPQAKVTDAGIVTKAQHIAGAA